MYLSVIIPTRNRSSLLEAALKSFIYQCLPKNEFEVVIVDNGSTDNTAQVISSYKINFSEMTTSYASEPGLHTGRHAGMTHAKGDILVFADDDIEALPTWLASIKECFSDSSVAMVGGNNFPMFLDKPPGWILKLWNRRNGLGYRSIPALSLLEVGNTKKAISPYWVWGCNFAIRKGVLLAAGGFHPDGMPKELIRFRGDGETHVSRFVLESKMKCIFHPGASVFHKVPAARMTHEYFYQRGFNQGISDSYTALRNALQISKSNKKFKFQRIIDYSKRVLSNLFDDKEVREAFLQFTLGHKNGFSYHQCLYRDDPIVREWVHKSVYY